MKRIFPTFPILLVGLALTGCATSQSFDVSIKNQTSRPIIVGFVKDGPPFEEAWASPEDYAQLPPSRQPATWGVVVPDGKIVTTHIQGKFERGSAPFLRVYLDEHSADQLLAISRGIGGRVDVGLHPGGDNRFVLMLDEHGKLVAKLARLSSR
jgi:hypothetical protein